MKLKQSILLALGLALALPTFAMSKSPQPGQTSASTMDQEIVTAPSTKSQGHKKGLENKSNLKKKDKADNQSAVDKS